MTRNEARIEKVSGGYIVHVAFPFADYAAQERRMMKTWAEVAQLLDEYFEGKQR